MDGIWTYGESLRFATSGGRTITIWEVGFTSGAAPTEVETFTAPGIGMLYGDLGLLPAPCRLALVFTNTVLVWDVQNSEYLLIHTGARFDMRTSFSSNGRFFACSAESDIYLWKESPAGYILHEKLACSTDHPSPLLSPNGESIVVFGGHTIRLWRTKSLTPPPSGISTQVPQLTKNLVLDFSPDGTLAVVTVQNDETVVVLNLKSGIPRLTIDAGVRVYGLRVIGNAVVVVGGEKAITWNLPAGDCVLGARVGLQDSSRTVGVNYLEPMASASISPDSRRVAVVSGRPFHHLSICSTSTGELLGESSGEASAIRTAPATTLWFSPDGCDLWCVRDNSEACRVWEVSGGWRVNEGWEMELLGLPGPEWRTVDVEEYPWRSSHGYQVTTDWWILSPDGKRLLMLPPPFQSHGVHRVWKGRFLALLHGGLSEAVILELDP